MTTREDMRTRLLDGGCSIAPPPLVFVCCFDRARIAWLDQGCSNERYVSPDLPVVYAQWVILMLCPRVALGSRASIVRSEAGLAGSVAATQALGLLFVFDPLGRQILKLLRSLAKDVFGPDFCTQWDEERDK